MLEYRCMFNYDSDSENVYFEIIFHYKKLLVANAAKAPVAKQSSFVIIVT